MEPRLTIFRMKREGRVLAAKVALAENGEVTFSPGDAYFGEVMRMIGKGIYAFDKQRVVGTDEGLEYFRAIESKFSRSSVWVVEAEGY
jgi:hypothetical protein